MSRHRPLVDRGAQTVQALAWHPCADRLGQAPGVKRAQLEPLEPGQEAAQPA
jgi:hypothetical protein